MPERTRLLSSEDRPLMETSSAFFMTDWKRSFFFLLLLLLSHSPSQLNNKYAQLLQIREYHRRHPNARVIDPSEDYEELLKEEPHVEFSGEEGYGRYLDMHELYNEYINSKFGKHIEYSVYLDVFSQPDAVPRNLKLTR